MRAARKGCTQPGRSYRWSYAYPNTGSPCLRHDQQGSRVPSQMYCVPGSRSSAVGTNGASTIASREVIRELPRLMVG
jgi:hypothetical protein